MNPSAAMGTLEQLHQALRKLNAALGRADTRCMAESVAAIDALLPAAGALDPASFYPAELARARQLTGNIFRLQEINQALCAKGLEVVGECRALLREQQDGREDAPESYAPDGAAASAEAARLNLSA